MVRITAKEIAQRLGVSRPTVSSVLSGARTNTAVSLQLRARILAEAKRSGYRPNAAAQAISSRRTYQIGVLVRNAPDMPLCYPAAYEMIQGINHELQARDYVLVLVRFQDVQGKGHAEQSRVFREHRLDGMIVVDAMRQEVYAEVERTQQHCVFLECNRWAPFGCVRRDEVHAGRMALNALAERGYSRMLYLLTGRIRQVSSGLPGYSEHFSASERTRGVKAAARAAGVELETLVLPRDPKVSEFIRYDDEVLAKLPVRGCGIISPTSHQAIRMVEAFGRVQGLYPGKDYGLICCDSTHEARMALSDLSVVRNNRFLLGKTAAEMVLRMIEDDDERIPSVRLRDEVYVGLTLGPRLDDSAV